METVNEDSLIPQLTLRPLLLGSSGGGGHNAAIKGIIEWFQTEEGKTEWIKTHYPQLHEQYSNEEINITIELGNYAPVPIDKHDFSLIAYCITFALFLGSWLKYFNNIMGMVNLPTKEGFDAELESLKTNNSNNRNYIDLLLDFIPSGYEFASIFNALQKADQIDDINKAVASQKTSDRWHYPIVYKKTLRLLLEAANNNTPYTEIISTQPQALAAICDAVATYNENYVLYNKTRLNDLKKLANENIPKNIADYTQEMQRIKQIGGFLAQFYVSWYDSCIIKMQKELELITNKIALFENIAPIDIHQYMTDLPIGASHFIGPLNQLSRAQLNQITLHAVDTIKPIEDRVENSPYLKKCYPINPKENPMVRDAFKKVETNNESICINDDIKIKNTDQVYSIMLGSLGGNDSLDYLQSLLPTIKTDDKVHHIFVFCGNNNDLKTKVNQINLQDYRNICIHALSQISDANIIAKIMCRSDVVITRSGGLSIMEHMAIPARENKRYFIHHPKETSDILSTGLGWEDANARAFAQFIQAQSANATVTTTNKDNISASLSGVHSSSINEEPQVQSLWNVIINFLKPQSPSTPADILSKSSQSSSFLSSYLFPSTNTHEESQEIRGFTSLK